MKRGMAIVLVIIALAVISGAYFLFNQPAADNGEVFCTQDAKLCPDGSYVGRDSGNNCEFFACPETNNPTNDTTSKTIDVAISGFEFVPATLEINVGDTVVWTNYDSAKHTVTSDTGNELDSSPFYKSGIYSHTFTTAGEYPYYCIYHPAMKAKVIVK